jgi:putative ABC transport system ATP-binding protein
VLQIQSLRYAWPGAATDCLSIPSLELKAGRKVFLHGPQRLRQEHAAGPAGRCAGGAQGQVSLLGQDWAALPGGARDARRADHVGVVFQQFNLLPYLTVLDNVLLPCRFSALRARRCAGGPVAAAQALLQQVGLPQASGSAAPTR